MSVQCSARDGFVDLGAPISTGTPPRSSSSPFSTAPTLSEDLATRTTPTWGRTTGKRTTEGEDEENLAKKRKED